MHDDLFEVEAEIIENKADKGAKYDFENQDLSAIAHQVSCLTKAVLLLARVVQHTPTEKT